MHSNTRGTFSVRRRAAAFARASNPHVLMISPPLNFDPRGSLRHVAYTTAKYGNGACAVLGMAEEFRGRASRQRTLARTPSRRGDYLHRGSRDVRLCGAGVVADAGTPILTSDAPQLTGRFCIDERAAARGGGDGFLDLTATRASASRS